MERAWDGGAIGAAHAIRALGRKDIVATGIDGGSEAFEHIKSDSTFCFTIAQSFYEQVYWNVYCAHEVLAGRRSPRHDHQSRICCGFRTTMTGVAWRIGLVGGASPRSCAE
ncbi:MULTISPECIES: sugar ABC transporter substrate-binding protein [unclassified Bradyrhizobium]